MDLHDFFGIGLTPDAYTKLLDDKQRDLHVLYERRMAVDKQVIEPFRSFGALRILVVTEPWCGDSLAILPAIAKLCEHAGIPLRVVLRDEHPELIDRYLTNGGRSIPIAIALDGEGLEIFHWGPRPAPAQAIFESHRPELAAGRIEKLEIHKKVRAFYARDNGQAVVRELAVKLAGAMEE